MGAFLDKPKTEKVNESGSAGRGSLRYGLASMQGWRVEMEDAHVARTSLPSPFSDVAFFAVFDGHAGSKIAKHSAQYLLDSIMHTTEFKQFTDEIMASRPTSETLATKKVDSDDEKLLNQDQRQASLVEAAMRCGFLALDEQMRSSPLLYSDNERSGTTCVCALIFPSHLFIANLGDSRAILARSDGSFFGTEDHKPYLPCERERIVNAGGSVMIQRVNGSLAVSRALGDYDYKSVTGLKPCDQLVSPEPDVYVIQRVKGPQSPQLGDSAKVSIDSRSVPSCNSPAVSDRSGLLTPSSAIESPSPDYSRPATSDVKSNITAAHSSPSAPCGDLATTKSSAGVPAGGSSAAPSGADSSRAAGVSKDSSPQPVSDPSTSSKIIDIHPLFADGGSGTGAGSGTVPVSSVWDEFLILACDGVFDVMTNKELCDFVRSRLYVTNRLDVICNQVLDSCLSKGSKDNMSVVLVTFPGAPQVSHDAVAREEQFEFHLRERINEIVSLRENIDEVDTDFVWRVLINQEIPGLPPGAGLHAALGLVESTLEDIKRSRMKQQVASSATCTPASSSPPTVAQQSPSASAVQSKKVGGKSVSRLSSP